MMELLMIATEACAVMMRPHFYLKYTDYEHDC